MASFYAELAIGGYSYPVRICRFSFTQATDERGRVVGKVRHGLVHLALDVPSDEFLLNWAATVHKPLKGHVTFFETRQRTARETVSFAAGECVGYYETFEAGNGGSGSYVCHLTIAATELVLTQGGPFLPFIIPVARDYVTAPAAPLPAVLKPVPKLTAVKKAVVVNLELGPNEEYRDAILLASERTQLDAAAIACIIDAEAAKKKGKWRADSVNSKTQATGLTQFLKPAWLDMARKPGTLLNTRAKELGYVNEKNKLVSEYEQELLELRKDPELSIVTAAEYGKSNLDGLEEKGLIPAKATPGEKARYLYILHHEGPGGAQRFLNKKSKGVMTKLKANLGGEEQAEAAVKQHGSAQEAYQKFLWKHTNDFIDPNKFRSMPTPKEIFSNPKPMG